MFAFVYIYINSKYIYTVHSYFVPCSKFYATYNPWNHEAVRSYFERRGRLGSFADVAREHFSEIQLVVPRAQFQLGSNEKGFFFWDISEKGIKL